MKKIICFGLILFILSTIFAQNQNDFYYSCVMHNTEKVKEYITKKSVDINHALSQDELISFLKYCADIEKTTYSDEVIEELEDFNLCPLTLSILDNGDFTQSSLSTFYCLVSNGANVNVKFKKDTFLYPSLYMSLKDKPDELYKLSEFLIKNGLDTNFIDNNGITPFFYVIPSNNLKLIELFLKHGTNVNYAAPSSGMTPLMGAVNFKNFELIDLLLKYKADTSAKDNKGSSIFMKSCKSDSLELVKKFYSKKALEERDNDGWTPLMYATVSGNIQIVNYLLEMGADINAKDNDNKPVLGHTMQDNYDLKKLLISKGAIVTEEYVLGFFGACPEETNVCSLLLPYVKVEPLDYRKARMDQYKKGTPVTVTFKCYNIDKKNNYYKVTGYMEDGSNSRKIFISFYERPSFLEYDTVSATVIYTELTDYVGNEIPTFSFICIN